MVEKMKKGKKKRKHEVKKNGKWKEGKTRGRQSSRL